MNTRTRTPQEPVGSGFGAKTTAAEVVEGVDLEEDQARGFVVDEGLTVLAKQQPVPEA